MNEAPIDYWPSEDSLPVPYLCTETTAVITTCEWFHLCTNPATGVMPHPVLADVPICDRCRTRIERM